MIVLTCTRCGQQYFGRGESAEPILCRWCRQSEETPAAHGADTLLGRVGNLDLYLGIPVGDDRPLADILKDSLARCESRNPQEALGPWDTPRYRAAMARLLRLKLEEIASAPPDR